eukprot:762754-Hanusia_phi.AAC.1
MLELFQSCLKLVKGLSALVDSLLQLGVRLESKPLTDPVCFKEVEDVSWVSDGIYIFDPDSKHLCKIGTTMLETLSDVACCCAHLMYSSHVAIGSSGQSVSSFASHSLHPSSKIETVLDVGLHCRDLSCLVSFLTSLPPTNG